MELELAVRQGADRLAVLADIGDQQDAPVGVVFPPQPVGRLGAFAHGAEIIGEARLRLAVEHLAAEHQHEVFEPGGAQRGDCLPVERTRQVEPADFGAKRR